MHSVIDHLMVASLLAASSVYAMYYLGPRVLRRWLLERAAAALAILPASFGLSHAAARLAEAARRGSGGCGGCNSCGPDPELTAAGAAPREIKIPVSQIGRR